jgi:succinate dehydrogenase / fumarate reductase flavoprotein subunit
VFLDVTHLGKDLILEKLPRMYRQFIEHQMLDISTQAMEVAPTAHYSMGGVVVEPETHATDVEGLFAAGEVCAGLHGANRLGGNSLSETLVFGKRSGEAAARHSGESQYQVRSKAAVEAATNDLNSFLHPGDEIVRPLQRALRNSMWERCGVVRSREGLEAGLHTIDEIRSMLPALDVRPTSQGYGDLAHALDLRASLLAAEASLRGALAREETRGAHHRLDHADLDPNLETNVRMRLGDDGHLTVTREPVAGVPAELRTWLEEADEVEVKGRLLE